MNGKKISLLLDVIIAAQAQLTFVQDQLTTLYADHLDRECGFHKDVRSLHSAPKRGDGL